MKKESKCFSITDISKLDSEIGVRVCGLSACSKGAMEAAVLTLAANKKDIACTDYAPNIGFFRK